MVVALAAMTAAALVQAMVTDGWEGVRHKVARLFGRGQPDVAIERRLDATRDQLTAATAGDLETAHKSPHVEIRAIAAGEVVHGDNGSQLMSKVRDQLNDAAAVDMESFGLYEAAHVGELPALAVRGISDCVGDKQPNLDAQWQPRAASHAAAFAFALLRKAEPEDFHRPGVQVPRPGGPPAGGARSPQEMLFRLPPPVAMVYEWALPIVGGRATSALSEFVALGGQPATWLSRFRHRPPALFRGDESGPLWVLVAEFADSHEHPTAPWLYQQAATRSADGILRAYLYSRAALGAVRDLGPGQPEELLANAETVEPAGHLLWEYHRAAVRSDTKAVLASALSLATVLDLGFSQPVLKAMGMGGTGAKRDDALVAFVEEFGERHAALLEQVRLFVALTAASALQVTGQLNAAQMLLEGLAGGLSAYGGGQPGVAALGSLVGARSSNVLLQIARILCVRVATPSSRETGFDRDAALARAEELALTARDRRRDWGGPTGEALAVAAHARAVTGDVRGALRLLLPTPLGTAGAEEAASQPVVRVAAELAVGTGNVELALELAAKIQDPAERRLATALALTLRRDSHPEAAAEYRSALAEPAISDRVDQQIRAFHGLAMVAELSSEEFARLEGIDPETADLIRAQSFLTAGRTSEAQILARRYDSDAALQIRVEGLVNQGKTADAIKALEIHAARHGGEHFLLQAAVIALSSGLDAEASRLATPIASSDDPGRRKVAREILTDAASRGGEWETVLAETHRLLNDEPVAEADPDRDANARKYRWARAQALHQLRRMDEAYEVIRAEPRLVPADLGQARLVVSILRTIAPFVKEASRPEAEPGSSAVQAEVLSVVTEAAQAFPEDEELVATAVMTAFSMPAAEPPDPLLMTKARQLQQQYFENFPDSNLIRAVPIDDDLTGVKEMLRTQLAPNAEMVEQMRRRAMVGQIPISVVTSMLQRSYAEALVCNAIGCYVISSSDDRIIAEEMEAARHALDGTVVIDTTALFLAPVVLGGITELKARFERLLVAAPQRDDILAARASLAMRAVGSLGWDPVSNRPTIVQYDEKLTERWASESERLAAALELCEVVGDLPHDGDPRNRAWTSPIRLARERGASLVADDAALRAAARSEGVATFGSLQLLAALVADGLLPTDALEDSYRRLMEIRAAELPVFARLLHIAEGEDWKPTGYAAFLFTRPSAWIPLSGGWQAYMSLIRALPDKEPDEVAVWCTSALFGLCLITPPQTVPVVAGALVAWTTLEVRDPAALPVLLANADRVVGQFVHGANLLKAVVQQLVTAVRQVMPPELVTAAVLPLLAGLDRAAHTQALGYFFTMP